MTEQATKKPPAAEPSTTSTAPKPAKKGSATKWLIGCCAVLLVCGLCSAVTGGLAYAFRNEWDIPVISDAVDEVATLGKSDDELAKESMEDLADTLIGSVAPLAEDVSNAEGIAEAPGVSGMGSISTMFSEDALEGIEQIESLRYTLDLEMDVDYDSSASPSRSELGTPSGLSYEINGSLEGDLNMKDENNLKANVVVKDFEYKSGGDSYSGNGEMRFIDDKMYIKIDEMPSFGGLFDTSEVEGQWYEDTVEATDSGSTTTEEEEITKEDIEKIHEFVTDDVVINQIEKIDDEKIEGVRCNCWRGEWNLEEFAEMLAKYDEIFTEEEKDRKTASEYEDYYEGLDKVLLEMCFSKKDNMVHRIRLQLTGSDTYTGDMKVDINAKLWDYGEDIEIEKPSNTKPYSQFEEDLMPSTYYEDEDWTWEDWDLETDV